MSKNRKKFLKLQYYRKKYGFTQSDFGILLGITTSAYNHKEIGISPYTFHEMTKIHRELNKQAQKHGDTYLSLDEIFLG